MRTSFLLPLLLLAASPAAAQDWSHARRVDVTLSSFSFSPESLRLRRGEPILLHLINSGNGGHNFSAPQFFAAASVRPEDAGNIRGGTVEVPGHQERSIRLIPGRGHYRLRCTHTLHSAFGMGGEIVVD